MSTALSYGYIRECVTILVIVGSEVYFAAGSSETNRSKHPRRKIPTNPPMPCGSKCQEMMVICTCVLGLSGKTSTSIIELSAQTTC